MTSEFLSNTDIFKEKRELIFEDKNSRFQLNKHVAIFTELNISH